MGIGNLQELSQQLRRERARSGMTVRQLAEASGIHPATVSRLESGQIAKPQPDHLQRLARAFGIDVEDLYATAGYLAGDTLPELTPYLRAKYGLTPEKANEVDRFMRYIARDDETTTKEGSHEPTGDTTT